MRRLADLIGVRAPSLYKHFANKTALETALVEEALAEIGAASHAALSAAGDGTSALGALLRTYRAHALANPNLYRLATGGPLLREQLSPGLEAWAGDPWYVATGDAALAQACWSFAHGMVILELDGRYPPGSDLEATWRAGAAAFAGARSPS